MNIVLLFPDQLRPDFLGCYNPEFNSVTPNINKLSSESIIYERAISPSPVCVPARASLLTGHNAIVNGVMNNTCWLRPDHNDCGLYTWPDQLSKNGYHTEAIGKMHFYPWDINEGFSHRIIAEDKRHIKVKDDYYFYLKSHNLEKYHISEHPSYQEYKGAVVSLIPKEHQVDKWVGDKCIEFIESYKSSKPFALMVGFPGPHCPYDPPPEYSNLFNELNMPEIIPPTVDSSIFHNNFVEANKLDWNGIDYSTFTDEQKRRVRSFYTALVYQIDIQIGRIIDTLKTKNLYENTVIILASDHGDYLGDFSMVGKGEFYDSAIKIPLVIRHPDYAPTLFKESSVSLTDLSATILTYAGINKETPDSKVLFPFAQMKNSKRDYIFGCNFKGFFVEKNTFKYCKYTKGSDFFQKGFDIEDKCYEMLFDLKNDPNEQNNLINMKEYNEIKLEMDRIIMHEVMNSIILSHSEKTVVESIEMSDGFSSRGWERDYPCNLIDGNKKEL